MDWAYSLRQLRRERYSVKGWMLALYQKPVGSMPYPRSCLMQATEQGAQQM